MDIGRELAEIAYYFNEGSRDYAEFLNGFQAASPLMAEITANHSAASMLDLTTAYHQRLTELSADD